ncbi:MAG: hypothetical protein GTN80_08250, partial [Nitrososphaeria archaeon]|nr:hypothetical protein [Nitrososphaeria archaeon]
LVGDIERHKRFLEILTRHDPVNCTTNTGIEGESKRLRYVRGWKRPFDRGVHESATLEEIRGADRPRGGSAVYNNREAVQRVVKELV